MELIKQNSQTQILKSLFVILMGSLVLTISAKIKIPFYPVPMTMQTLVVLFLGIAFGYKIGLASVILYLFEGIIGLPVFSNSPEKGVGLIYFTGPTMGYLIGFLFAVFLIGKFRLHDWSKYNNKSYKFFFINFIKLLISVSAIYFFGLLWLTYLIGLEKALLFGLKPFLLAELFKMLILAFLIPIIFKLKNLSWRSF